MKENDKTDKVNVKELITKLKAEILKAEIPQELVDKLEFEEIQDWLTIKPGVYLGSDVFAKIRNITIANGGDYFSAEKYSHFRIRVKPAAKTDVLSLKQWYAEEAAKQEKEAKPLDPLTARMTVNLNVTVSKADEVGPIMSEFRKHVKTTY